MQPLVPMLSNEAWGWGLEWSNEAWRVQVFWEEGLREQVLTGNTR